MTRITKKQILMLHKQLIDEYGGSHGVRDENLLESALETPFRSFGGEELYPGVQAKAVISARKATSTESKQYYKL